MEWLDILETAKEVGPHGTILVVMGTLALRELAKMRKSVEKLNVGMAIVVERIGGHEKRITTLERKKK